MTASRRDMLTLLGGTSVSLLTSQRGLAAEMPAFVDSSTWKKHGELFRHQGEPTNAWVQNFTSTAESLENDRWRLWTSVSGPKGVAKNIGYHEGKIGGEW